MDKDTKQVLIELRKELSSFSKVLFNGDAIYINREFVLEIVDKKIEEVGKDGSV